MKKTKLLILTAMSALLLVGCNNTKTGTLPSGGKSVDVTTEGGEATLKDKLSATIEAYKNLKLDSASVTATASGVKASADVKATVENVGDINLKANLKDFGAKVELKAARHTKGEGEEYDSLDASLVAKTTNGSFSLNGTVPGKEEGKTSKVDASLSLKGAEVGAYIKGDKLYANFANSGNEQLANNADSFANKLLGQLNESVFAPLLPSVLSGDDFKDIYDAEKGKFVIADAYKEMAKEGNIYLSLGKPVEFPTIDVDEQDEDYKELIDSILELASNDVGFLFKTYSNNAYGFQLAMNKTALKALIALENKEDSKETIEQIDKYIKNFSFNADVYFNKDALLESAGVSFNIEANLDKDSLGEDASMFTAFTAKVSASGSAKVEVKYNSTKVEFPSFDGYKEIKLFGNK